MIFVQARKVAKKKKKKKLVAGTPQKKKGEFSLFSLWRRRGLSIFFEFFFLSAKHVSDHHLSCCCVLFPFLSRPWSLCCNLKKEEGVIQFSNIHLKEEDKIFFETTIDNQRQKKETKKKKKPELFLFRGVALINSKKSENLRY